MINTYHITVIKKNAQYWAELDGIAVTTADSAWTTAQALVQALTVDAHQASNNFIVDKTSEDNQAQGPWQFIAYRLCSKCKKREFDTAAGCHVPAEQPDGTWQCNRFNIQRVAR